MKHVPEWEMAQSQDQERIRRATKRKLLIKDLTLLIWDMPLYKINKLIKAAKEME